MIIKLNKKMKIKIVIMKMTKNYKIKNKFQKDKKLNK